MFQSEENRDLFIKEAFQKAIDDLAQRLGDDMNHWQYGQVDNKHIYMNHALGRLGSDELKSQLNVGPFPRGGNAYTPSSTGSNLNQSSGASFRIIVNTGNWDETIGSNSPGQSGDPDSKFYRNLFESWAKDEYFPVLFSREKIDSAAVEKLILVPD